MKMVFDAKNIYSNLLFLLIFLIPFSDKLNLIDLGFIHIFAFRVILAFTFILLLFKKEIKLNFFLQTKWLSFFISYLLLYGLISLIFVESRDFAVKQLFYLATAFFLVVVFYTLLKVVHNPVKVVVKAWTLSFIIMAFFGIIEILTNAHFISGYTTHLESFDFIRPSFNAPLVSFTNPNDFSIYLCVSIVLFLYNYFEVKSTFSIILIVVAYFLLYNTLSRFGLTAVYLMLFCSLLLVLYRNRWIWLKTNYLQIIGYASVTILVIAYMVMTNPIGKPIEKDGAVKMVEVPLSMQGLDFLFSTASIPQDSTGSTAVRKNLILNGLQFAWQSKGLGIGAGQFEYKMKTNQGQYFTNNVNSPHHFVIEILSQFGVIPLILLILFFVSIMWVMMKFFMKKRGLAVTNNFVLLTSLIIVYVLTSNSASSYIPHTLNWILLTLIIYIFNEIKEVNLIK